MRQDRSAALAALSLAYDGPAPVALREAAVNGGEYLLRDLRRRAEARHLDRRALACRARIAANRLDADESAQELTRLRALGLALRELGHP